MRQLHLQRYLGFWFANGHIHLRRWRRLRLPRRLRDKGLLLFALLSSNNSLSILFSVQCTVNRHYIKKQAQFFIHIVQKRIKISQPDKSICQTSVCRREAGGTPPPASPVPLPLAGVVLPPLWGTAGRLPALQRTDVGILHDSSNSASTGPVFHTRCLQRALNL